MTARILVVDDNVINCRLLQAKLTGEYYQVETALSGRQALELVEAARPDLILLDVMMPDLTGYQVCQQLKADGRLSHIPVVMVTALDTPDDIVKGLNSGADDFLTKPLDDLALFARVRSLVRLKRVLDEWRLREGMGLVGDTNEALLDEPVAGASLVAFTESPHVRNVIMEVASALDQDVSFPEIPSIDALPVGQNCDLILADVAASGFDGLKLCSDARSQEATRHLPFVLVGDKEDKGRVFRGLDLGATEYLMRPLNPAEVAARLTTQVRRHRLQQRIQQRHMHSLDQAMHDQLTGLYNRHYLQAHLPRLQTRSRQSRSPLSMIVCDLDHFKSINDTYGHAAGDLVLQSVSNCLSSEVRTPDFVARFGGEEFIVLLPDATLSDAEQIAERLRLAIAGLSVPVHDSVPPLAVTASFGVSSVLWDEASADPAICRADAALYRAKARGRNQLSLIHISEPTRR